MDTGRRAKLYCDFDLILPRCAQAETIIFASDLTLSPRSFLDLDAATTNVQFCTLYFSTMQFADFQEFRSIFEDEMQALIEQEDCSTSEIQDVLKRAYNENVGEWLLNLA